LTSRASFLPARPPTDPSDYHDEIVQAHHLDPLSERKEPKNTKLDDLITLCPNCHYIAHFLLRRSATYKRKAALVSELKTLKDKA